MRNATNLVSKISVIADFDRNHVVAGADRIDTSMRPGHQGGYTSPVMESLCWAERPEHKLPQAGHQPMFGAWTGSPSALIQAHQLALGGLKPAARLRPRFLARGC